ncbi:hypothetical protein KFE25_013043 [Diacronema lutheri]|uniref:Uncharacterized protein n=2 Tax=Diacronema lutheri TaxID=2081491 RepID=A0A8J5XEP3_DIALT|nr:hypothetical protein KFE25_013043 [Diacronema lutheri]
MPGAALARLMPAPPGPVPFGRGEQHPVFHFPGTSFVLDKPITNTSASSLSSFPIRGISTSTSGVRFAVTHQDRVAPRPGPGAYDYHLPTSFDVAGMPPKLSPLGEARSAHMRATSELGQPSRVSERVAPLKKEPVSTPSPVRYAPLSRADMANIAGPPALLFDRHSADTRSALTNARASGLGSLPATRLYSVHRARIQEVAPGMTSHARNETRGFANGASGWSMLGARPSTLSFSASAVSFAVARSGVSAAVAM